MFTGIVEEIGVVRHVTTTASGARLEISSTRVAPDLGIDSSVNVAGACLTVIERDDHHFAVDLVRETLAKTTLGRAIRGTRVNLERAATPTTALGGHFVQGHVDATTQLAARPEVGGDARRTGGREPALRGHRRLAGGRCERRQPGARGGGARAGGRPRGPAAWARRARRADGRGPAGARCGSTDANAQRGARRDGR